MAIDLPKRQELRMQAPVMQWLFDSDPSIRWQVMRDLIDASAAEVAAERARVATEGAGAPGCLPSKGPTGGGAVRRGTAGGTRPCTS